jgi:competence protein ComEC
VPHHGSSTSSPRFFVEARAQIALISAGAGNTFGHPTEETLDALDGAEVYRTDIHGRVVLRTDGNSWRIATHE